MVEEGTRASSVGMALKLYFHPLASFCHKALIALYENRIPFEPIIVDLGDEASRAAFRAVWPMAKMPVLRRGAQSHGGGVDHHHRIPGRALSGPDALFARDVDRAWQTRMWDRFYDHYVQEPMQKIVADRLRPEGKTDAYGVELAKGQLQKAYGVMEREMGSKSWAIGADFTLADCAAAPALFYANTVVPFAETHENLAAYLDRLMARPSFARVLEEAQPYFNLFPLDRKPTIARAGRVARR